jgi:hypothetical protein
MYNMCQSTFLKKEREERLYQSDSQQEANDILTIAQCKGNLLKKDYFQKYEWVKPQ